MRQPGGLLSFSLVVGEMRGRKQDKGSAFAADILLRAVASYTIL